jgi:Rrf2 family protein
MATKKAMYAVRAVTALAIHFGRGWLPAPAIAEAERIPGRFCESTLTHLKCMRLLESERGRDGGFALARPPERITVADVIEAVDGRIGPATFNGDGAEDDDLDADVREVFRRAHEAMVKVLREETVADLVVKRKKRQGDDS